MRSPGPGGQRNGLSGGEITNTPPSGMASSCFLSSRVCAPAFQAWGICSAVPASRPSIASQRKSMPGETMQRSKPILPLLAGAEGQELRSLEVNGKPLLSAATETLVPKAGKRWGGAQMRLQFTAGSLAGKYRPTLVLLRESENLASGVGSSYTYTIVVE